MLINASKYMYGIPVQFIKPSNIVYSSTLAVFPTCLMISDVSWGVALPPYLDSTRKSI